tara:strand:+ start:191 stop:397 length:207 start_codon:yes stop_codon:yes gene_type:complete
MYDDSMEMIEITIDEYENLKDKLSEYAELLEQLTSVYEALTTDLLEIGEIELDEVLEQCQKTYSEQFE